LVRCQCGAIFVDGGRDYLRRGGNPDNIINTAIVESDEPYEDELAARAREIKLREEAHVNRPHEAVEDSGVELDPVNLKQTLTLQLDGNVIGALRKWVSDVDIDINVFVEELLRQTVGSVEPPRARSQHQGNVTARGGKLSEGPTQFRDAKESPGAFDGVPREN
jgi:hypothetical protein